MQILFDPAQYAGLEALARSEHRSVASVVRESVDERLARSRTVRQAALERLLTSADAAPDATVADWEAVKAGFDDRPALDALR